MYTSPPEEDSDPDGLAPQLRGVQRLVFFDPWPTAVQTAPLPTWNFVGEAANEPVLLNVPLPEASTSACEGSRTAKASITFDEQSSSLEVVQSTKKQPRLFGALRGISSPTVRRTDCLTNCLVEPNYSDHGG